jgi:putative flavoprotein involved in K+ transport
MSPASQSPTSDRVPHREHYDVIVIGAGQTGLSAGYYLKQRGLRFLIVDGNLRVGDAWRKRWDSLRLFTPARFDGLAGLPFPAPGDYFPTRAEMADYLEQYARHFELPVRLGVAIESLERRGERFVLRGAGLELEADQVIVAMTNLQKSKVPEFASELAPDIQQLHSSSYRGPEQLPDGPVLVVGAGNSGAEIGLELASSGRKVLLSGREVGEAPFRMSSFWGRLLFTRLLLRVVFHRILTIKTPIGRKARARGRAEGHVTPLLRTRGSDLVAAGAERVARVAGVRDGVPVLEDGRRLEVKSVVWCTGYHAGFSWIRLPCFDEQGEPAHEAGISTRCAGLYFLGLNFLYSFSSPMIHGVGRDAERVVAALARRRAQLAPAAGSEPDWRVPEIAA